MSDASELLAMINTVLDNNPQSIEDFKNGKDRAVGFLVGQVMKASKGQANPAMTNKLIQEELKKRQKFKIKFSTMNTIRGDKMAKSNKKANR